jgi:aerobic carbon-monoxide dehydrogenase large subunit
MPDCGSVDVSQAAAARDVLAVITGPDVAHLGSLPVFPIGPDIVSPPQPPLVRDAVRMVGDPVAAVVAQTRALAADALDLIRVDYEPLAVVADAESAVASDAPRLHEHIPDNVVLRWSRKAGNVDDAFSRAHRVVEVRIHHARVAPVPMETRGVLASFDPPREELTIWSSTQSPFRVRMDLAAVLGFPEQKIRVITPDVGGGFGAKLHIYREDVLAAFLSIRLGRPVKWAATRMEDLATTQGAREEVDLVEAAVEEDGRITALRIRNLSNLGAYLNLYTAVAPVRVLLMSSGPYAIPNLDVEVAGVLTNTAPTGPYRGAGRPEAAFVAERVIDQAARELGLDPADVRRRNFIPPEAFPYTVPTGQVYDSGDYGGALDRLLDISDYANLRRQQAERRSRGELVGIGLATYIESTGGGGWESALVRVERSGTVTAVTGACPQGQGHETTFAQIVADELGLPFENVVVRYGDTAGTPPGIGTFGSRSTPIAGGGLAVAAGKVREKAIQVAASLLEAQSADLEYVGGGVRVRGAPERSTSLAQIAQASWAGLGLPPGLQPGLEETVFFAPKGEAVSFGAYLAQVAIERDTGRLTVERLVAVDDCGTVVNPLLLEGQVHGSLAQGVGQALWEQLAYDLDGQLLASSLMDYTVPTARQLPVFELDRTITLSPHNPLGAKGVGEAGCIGAPPALVNATIDALAPLGVTHLDMPLRPEKIWRALGEGEGD